MANNVVIKTRTASMNLDILNRTAKCASDIQNGSVFKLATKSTTAGEGNVWVATQASATDKGLWMATSPEVVITKVNGLEFKGIVVDPTAFTNIAGHMIDAIKLNVGDEIEIYTESIEDIATSDYLIPATSDFALEASTTTGTGLTLKKTGTGILHIGQGSIAKATKTTYKYEVTIN